ncbi:hypothetical protein JCM24511_02079 [Saitozyma sp. JCM 24511]|nr:hypothetical protein JCM24511_02079 [Saitozyma sp. JCM 24511]
MLTAVYLHIQGRYGFIDYPGSGHGTSVASRCFASPNAPIDHQIGAFFIWTMYASGVSFARFAPSLNSAETYLEATITTTVSVKG